MSKKTITGEDGKIYTLKEKKPFYKKVWFWIVCAIFILFIFSPKDDSEEKKKNNEQAKIETTHQDKKPSTTKNVKSKNNVNKIGDTAKVGDIAFKVKSVDTSNTIRSEKANGTYYIVEVTTINKSNKAQNVSDGDFKLVNGKKEYESDNYVGTIYNAQRDHDTTYFFEKINPDMKVNGYIVFDIPKNVAKKELKLRMQPNQFINKKSDILLQK